MPTRIISRKIDEDKISEIVKSELSKKLDELHSKQETKPEPVSIPDIIKSTKITDVSTPTPAPADSHSHEHDIFCPTCNKSHIHSYKQDSGMTGMKLKCVGPECGRTFGLIGVPSTEDWNRDPEVLGESGEVLETGHKFYQCNNCGTPLERSKITESEKFEGCPFCSNKVMIPIDLKSIKQNIER